jgi:hypothetical protein
MAYLGDYDSSRRKHVFPFMSLNQHNPLLRGMFSQKKNYQRISYVPSIFVFLYDKAVEPDFNLIKKPSIRISEMLKWANN